jgi:TolB-like protein
MSFLQELKRRNVFRVGIAYSVASWLLLQLTEVLIELLEIGPEVGKIVIVLLIVGLIPALILAWAFEMTPEGVKREKDVDRSQSITPKTGHTLDRAIIGMLALVAGYFIWESRFKADNSEPAIVVVSTPVAAPAVVVAAAEQQKSIVVLPFVNMSNDPDQEFFSDGLSEEILNALVKIQDLRVISRTSAFAFKGKDVSIPDIAAKLNVSHVLEGSVRKAGNEVRITAQLIEVATDSHLWSEAYNRSLENIFEIQEEISGAIAKELQVTLGKGLTSKQPTNNIRAYQMFLQGRHLYQDRGGEELDRSIKILREVVAMEPNFADAWANLAGASIVRGFQVDEGYEALNQQGREAARRAVEIDPDNGFGHAALGLLLMEDFQWEEAMAELDRAIELNPNESNSLLWKGIGLLMMGYHSEALEILLQAESVDPVFALLQGWIGIAYIGLGDADSVYRHAIKERDIALNSDEGILFPYHLIKGNLEAAEKEWAAADMANIDSDLLVRTVFEAIRDNTQRAKSIETLLANEELASSRTLFPYLWYLGATDETLAQLNKTIDSDRGLRAQIGLVTLWAAYNRQYLNDPNLIPLFERTRVADYWRKHGNPDFCQVNPDDSFSCGEP